MTLVDTLEPGDVLLYSPKGLFGWIIRIKTWHKVAHCEVYIGGQESVASRDGIGVGRYPLRAAQLVTVCRMKPDAIRDRAGLILPFNMPKAMRWFASMKGTPYGWSDLIQFAGFNVDGWGIVCSPFVARFLRNGGLDPFNGEDPLKIAPFQFALSNCFVIYDVKEDQLVAREHQPEPEIAA
jgi:hypothetical protein